MGTIRRHRVSEGVSLAVRGRVLGGVAVVVALALLDAVPVRAQSAPRFTPTLGAEASWTNNVDLLPPDQQRSDFVFIVTPGLTVDYEAARIFLRGYVNVPIRLYARTGEDNNEVSPQADLLGRVTLVDKFLFVEAQATVQQTYLNPFGPRPVDLINATDNRYTSQTYRITPYVEGYLSNNLRYLLKNDNIWTNANSIGSASEYSYTNYLYGYLDRDPLPFGWRLVVERNEYRFEDQSRTQLLELVRALGTYRPDPTLELFASGGYEHNRFPLSSYSGAIYGAGVRWRPNERTSLDAAAEHRFFGTSYLFNFNHRMARTTWQVNAKRDATTYPQQVASLPVGASVTGALDNILQSRLPDPTERAQYIANFVNDRGLPATLVEPLAIYTQLLYLQESATIGTGLLGARNAVFANAFWNRTQAISASGQVLPPVIGGDDNNTQVGGSVAWSWQLTPLASLTASGTYTRTESLAQSSDASDQYDVRIVLTRPLSPKTLGFAGARYQRFDSTVEQDYREAAVFVGVNHSFR